MLDDTLPDLSDTDAGPIWREALQRQADIEAALAKAVPATLDDVQKMIDIVVCSIDDGSNGREVAMLRRAQVGLNKQLRTTTAR